MSHSLMNYLAVFAIGLHAGAWWWFMKASPMNWPRFKRVLTVLIVTAVLALAGTVQLLAID